MNDKDPHHEASVAYAAKGHVDPAFGQQDDLAPKAPEVEDAPKKRKPMLNPHLYTPAYFRGGTNYRKVYWGAFRGLRALRRPWLTATKALAYSRRVHARWCRLYKAAIERMAAK